MPKALRLQIECHKSKPHPFAMLNGLKYLSLFALNCKMLT